MPFFEDIDSLQIVENHISKLRKVEEEQAKILIKRYTEARHTLSDRLNSVRADSFTANQLRGTLLQVNTALSQMTKNMQEDMLSGAEIVAESGVEDLVEELERFQDYFGSTIVPINVDAAAVATETSAFLINQYETSMQSYAESLRQQIGTNLGQAIIEQTSYAEIVKKINEFFLGEEWKVHRIARTELHNLYNKGKLRGMNRISASTFPDLMKALVHPMDARTAEDSKYVRSLNLRVPLDMPFSYRWPPLPSFKSQLREYMTPPDRPNDRSILVPYRPEWDEEQPGFIDQISEAANLLSGIAGQS